MPQFKLDTKPQVGADPVTPDNAQFIGFVLFGVAIVFRLLFGRFVKRGDKYSPDAEFYAPLASRWLTPRTIEIGAWVGVVLTLVAGALVLYGFVVA